jgi:hypothetical protein
MRPRNEEGGELVAVGSDTVRLPLQGLPHRVEVKFRHKHEPPPCDPHHHHHHHDELEWSIHRDNTHHHEFTLVIKWKVYDVREIFWVAYY